MQQNIRRRTRAGVLVTVFACAAVLSTAGCRSAYYTAWESVGVHKRDLLVSRVEKARDSRQDAKEQFSSALDRFNKLLGTDGGNEAGRKKVGPVLAAFRDEVLFLKHNLNVQAITSLSAELDSIEIGVERLIKEMNASIAEADRFIAELRAG